MRRGATIAAGASVLALAAAAAGVGIVSSRGNSSSGVVIAAVDRGTVQEVVEAPGTVIAHANATVNSPTTGSVRTLAVKDGQRVRAGQLLMTLESPSARRQLQQAQSADRQAASAGTVSIPSSGLSAQQSQADRNARQGFSQARLAATAIADPAARAQALTAVVAAETQYTAAQTAAMDAIRRFDAGLGSLAAAVGSLAGAQRIQTRAAVSIAQQAVDSLVVRAPIDGVVALGGDGSAAASPVGGDLSGILGSLPASISGQAASALGGAASGSSSVSSGPVEQGTPVTSSTVLATITDASELALTADVDETDVLLVVPGVHASAELDAVPDATYSATVTAVEPAPVSSSRGGVSFRVRLRLGAGTTADGRPAPTPRPGMSTVVDLRVRTAKDVVQVPVSAVIRDGSSDTVWVVRGRRITRQTVKLGAQGEDTVQIASGLAAGDRIVVHGADRVHDGQQV